MKSKDIPQKKEKEKEMWKVFSSQPILKGIFFKQKANYSPVLSSERHKEMKQNKKRKHVGTWMLNE